MWDSDKMLKFGFDVLKWMNEYINQSDVKCIEFEYDPEEKIIKAIPKPESDLITRLVKILID